MNHVQILIALEFLSHRESLAEMLRARRPEAVVVEVDPGELDAAIFEYVPDLVISGALSEVIETCVYGWVVLYPSGQDRAILNLGGTRWQQTGINVGHLLQFIDDATVHLRV